LEGQKGLKKDKDGSTFYWRENDVSEGSERVSRKVKRGRRGMESRTRKIVCVLFEEEYILYKG